MQKKQKDSIQKPRIIKNKKDIRSSSIPPNILEMLETPFISDIEAPHGFRTVSNTHAILEFAKPVLEFQKKGIIEDLNEALRISTLIWNYVIDLESNVIIVDNEDLLFAVSKTLKMTKQKSKEFIESMIQRKHILLPDSIQPENSRFKFIKKENYSEVVEFDYSTVSLSDEILPLDNDDNRLLEMINRMDKNIKYDADYSKWENFFFKFEEYCRLRFTRWIIKKGAGNYSEEFCTCIEIFLSFIYRYAHSEKIYLKSINKMFFEEFFCDHILRKLYGDPDEYLIFPSAIKTFYKFLAEKKYLTDETPIIKIIDEYESILLEIVKERFS